MREHSGPGRRPTPSPGRTPGDSSRIDAHAPLRRGPHRHPRDLRRVLERVKRDLHPLLWPYFALVIHAGIRAARSGQFAARARKPDLYRRKSRAERTCPDTAELCHKGTITGHDLVPFRERDRDNFSTDAANRKRNGDRDGFGSTSPKAATCRSTPRKTSTGSPRNSTTDPAND